MRRHQLMILVSLLFPATSGVAAAKPPQLVYLHKQSVKVVYSAGLGCTCMSGPNADPPRGSDEFHLFAGEVVATMVVNGQHKETKSLQKALKANQLRIVGSGSARSLAVQVVKPTANVHWELSVVRPTLAVPDRHGLKKEALQYRIARFAQFEPALAKIDDVRASLRSAFSHSAMPSTQFGLALLPHFWSGTDHEFPWTSDPQFLDQWTALAVRKSFLIASDPELTYLQSSLLAGKPLRSGQWKLLAKFLGENQISAPSQMGEAEQQVRALTTLPQARTIPGIFRLTQAAAAKENLTKPSILRELYQEMAEEYHRRELRAAQRDLKPGDVVLHLFDNGLAFMSERDSAAPTRLEIPSLADAVHSFSRDFQDGGLRIIKQDRQWLEAAMQGKRPNGQSLSPRDAGAYFQILGAILKHLPPPTNGKKLNLLVWLPSRFQSFNLAGCYALLRAAKVSATERDDLRWLEVADGPTRLSPLSQAARHLRHLEKFPDDAAEILALTVPMTAGEAGAHEWATNLVAQFFTSRAITHKQYQRDSLPAVLKLKTVVLGMQGAVIQPPTLQSFLAALKKHIESHPGAAISVTIMTHRQKDQELVYFAEERVPIELVLHHLVAADLRQHYVTFSVLCCGFASSKYGTLFQDRCDISLLMAPFQDIEVSTAARFQTLVNTHRKGRGGLTVLDAIEAARLQILKEERFRLRNNQPPKSAYPMELPRSRVARPRKTTMLAA